jgi:2OG-Fe(II) oxygenase superfamily
MIGQPLFSLAGTPAVDFERTGGMPVSVDAPVLSLGATRRFLIRPDGGRPSTTIVTHGGDLVVMGGRCQRDYQHSVPKQRQPAAARVSLNFSIAR